MSGVATGPTERERALVAAARAGDEGAFQSLVEPHQSELQAHCYRMLGSVHDAEDAVQEALLRAWRGMGRFEARSTARAWLYRIATNACLDAIARRKRRVLPADHGPPADPHDGPGAPLVESVWIEPYPDGRLGEPGGAYAPEGRYERRESVELAFTAALQHLPPRQRAALIFRDVLGFSARETAEALETSVPSANSALQRARAAVDQRLPDESQQATLRALGDARLRQIVDDYVEAWEAGDVETIVGMLSEEVLVAMPPMATWFRGRDAAETFLREWAFARRWEGSRFGEGQRRVRLVPARAGGQVAFGAYGWDEGRGVYLPYALQVLALRGDRIDEITAFVAPEAFACYGLPEALPA